MYSRKVLSTLTVTTTLFCACSSSDDSELDPPELSDSQNTTGIENESGGEEEQDESNADSSGTSNDLPSGDPSGNTNDHYELGECPTQRFLDLSEATPPDGYPSPTLEVSCTDDEVTVSSNGIPNFEYLQVTPNVLAEQDYEWKFPRNPKKADSFEDIPLGGPTAIAINGLPIFGPTEAPMDGYRDPVLDEILDYCGGHTAPGGVYHFHFRPDCIYEERDGSASIIIGYSFDGFPIFGPWACEDSECTSVYKVKSSWQPSDNSDPASAWEQNEYVEGLGDLDECNGTIGPDGNYRYYATDEFPYFMGCYYGTPTNNRLGGPMP